MRSREAKDGSAEQLRSTVMEVTTSRFGIVEIAEDRVIHIPKGLLGFGSYTRFCLLQPSQEACFYWLQSLDDPELAFVVTDPTIFEPTYAVPIRSEQMADLRLRSVEDSQVLVIVNKVGDKLTGNLQGPVVINTLERLGEQFVLADRRWTTRHELAAAGQALATTARAASA